mgnify:CR=1 FL=1
MIENILIGAKFPGWDRAKFPGWDGVKTVNHRAKFPGYLTLSHRAKFPGLIKITIAFGAIITAWGGIV